MLENPKPWENITSWEAKNRKPYFIIVNFSGVESRVVKLVFHTNARILASIIKNMTQMMKVIIDLMKVKEIAIPNSIASFVSRKRCAGPSRLDSVKPCNMVKTRIIVAATNANKNNVDHSRIKNKKMERVKRFELSASTLARLRSSQLSYTRRKIFLILK